MSHINDQTESLASFQSPTPRTQQVFAWIAKGAVILAMLTLVGLQCLGLMGLSEDRANSRRMEDHIMHLQAQLTDLRDLVGSHTAEELIFFKILVLNPRVAYPTARKIASAVYQFSRRYNRDPDLILAIIHVESGFDPTIVSHMGAIGLMQIMPQWIDVLDISCDLNNPDCNVRYGLQILGTYEQLYGKLDMALTAFNRGPGPVDYALMKGKDPDNGYANKVRTVYDRLRAMTRTHQELEVAYSKP